MPSSCLIHWENSPCLGGGGGGSGGKTLHRLHVPWVLLWLRQGGLGCVFSRAGNRITNATRSRPPPPLCHFASTTYKDSVLCSGHQLTAGSPSQGGTCVCACWQPVEAFGGCKGGEVFHHPGGSKAGDHLRGPPNFLRLNLVNSRRILTFYAFTKLTFEKN